MYNNTLTVEVMNNKTWTALGSHGGFQTLVFPRTSNKFYLAVCHFINTL